MIASTRENVQSLLILNLIISILGILGCLLLILTYIMIKQIRKYTLRLILYLMISDCIYSIASASNTIFALRSTEETAGIECILNGFLKIVSILCSCQLGCAIAWTLYSRTKYGDHRHKYFEISLIIGSITFSIALASLYFTISIVFIK